MYYAGHEIWTDTIGNRGFTVGFFFEWCMTEVKNNIAEKYGGIFFGLKIQNILLYNIFKI